MPLWSYNGAPFDIEDAKMGRNDGDGTYSMVTDVPSVQLLGITHQMRSGQLDGDGGITAVAAKIISAQVTLRFGGVSLELLYLLGAGNIQSSGVTPNRNRRIEVARNRTQYLALCGKALSAEGTGDFHLFVPKAKVTGDFELRMESGAFIIPELTLFAVADENVLDDQSQAVITTLLEYETAVSVAIPPA